jgi:hypothetical protein
MKFKKQIHFGVFGFLGLPCSSKIYLSIQGSTKLIPAGQLVCWIFVLVQKDSNAKKKVVAARNLKDCLPNLPLETGKAKKKIKVF